MTKRSISYRPEIDGLRALAVLPVLFFHADLGFSGGFVGVDVFFVISGFLIGSLYLVWPWKHTLSYYQNSKGEQMALVRENVLPGGFLELAGADPQTLMCLVLALGGLFAVLLLEFFGAKSAKSA